MPLCPVCRVRRAHRLAARAVVVRARRRPAASKRSPTPTETSEYARDAPRRIDNREIERQQAARTAALLTAAAYSGTSWVYGAPGVMSASDRVQLLETDADVAHRADRGGSDGADAAGSAPAAAPPEPSRTGLTGDVAALGLADAGGGGGGGAESVRAGERAADGRFHGTEVAGGLTADQAERAAKKTAAEGRSGHPSCPACQGKHRAHTCGRRGTPRRAGWPPGLAEAAAAAAAAASPSRRGRRRPGGDAGRGRCRVHGVWVAR